MAYANTNVNPPADVAADWAARIDAGPLSRSEEDDFQHWLNSNPANKAHLESYIRLYGRLSERIPALIETGRLAPNGDLPATVVHPPKSLFRRLSVAFAAAAAIAVGFFAWSQWPETHETHAAQRQSLDLADGSHIDLNARTSLSVRLRGGERRVKLEQGEAYFAVAKDPSRPFFVETPHGVVRVTGTHFDVRADDAAQLEVTVIEGSVAVKSVGNDASFQLKSHDQLALTGENSSVSQLSAGATEDAIAWREGRAVFDSEPLATAVGRFARYHGVQIEVAPPIAKLELGGRFKLDDLDHFLQDVALTLPVRVLHAADGSIRIVGR